MGGSGPAKAVELQCAPGVASSKPLPPAPVGTGSLDAQEQDLLSPLPEHMVVLCCHPVVRKQLCPAFAVSLSTMKELSNNTV